MSEQFLITTEELAEENSQGRPYRIIDTRNESIYQNNHIPGAINIPDFFTYICTRNSGGHLAMVNHFAKIFGRFGISREDPIVFYEDAMDNGYGQSCRGWFIANLMGHTGSILVLHGGIRAWKANRLPLSTEIPPISNPSIYTPVINDSIVLTAEQMLAGINNPEVAIVDVRDYAEWIGANSSPYGYDYCPRKGRIPGSIWLEWYRLMKRHNGIPMYKSPEEILDVCHQAGIPMDKTIYLYCFKGARTSNVMLALKMAGLSVKNYFSSWNEWSRDPSLPVEEDYPESPLIT